MAKLQDLRPLPVGAKIKVVRSIWVAKSGKFEEVPYEYQVGTILPDGTLDGGCGCCGDSLAADNEVEILSNG